MQGVRLERVRLACLTLAVVGLVLPAAQADAAGFAAARFGGERGNPTEFNPSTLYYNPAGIGMSTGFQLMLDVNLVWRTASYERPESAIDESTLLPGRSEEVNNAIRDVNSGEGTLNNFLYSPMVGLSYNFRDLGLPLGVGVAFYAPFGGQAEWDRPGGDARFPGSGDGPQRWFTIDGSIRTLALTAGVAYHIESARLSLGAAFNYYMSDIDTIRARNRLGEDHVLTNESPPGRDDDPIAEGRAWVVADSTDFGLGVGALWEPIEDRLWIGLSWQSRPNFDGNMEFEGELIQILGNASTPEVYDMKATQQLPDIWRLGVRYRADERLELRLFGDITRWSVFREQCLVDTAILGDRDLQEFCRTRSDGSPATEGIAGSQFLTVIPRRWNDAFGVRLGASYWFKPELELMLGLGYDGNAVPDRTLEPALIDADKISASIGLRYDVLQNLAMMFTLTNIFFVERDTTGQRSADSFAVPTRQPNSTGVYNQNFLLFGTNLQVMF